MYGTYKDVAEVRAAELRLQHPENRYEVAPESFCTKHKNIPLTWGVQRYVRYCKVMPWKPDGFVWLEPKDISEIVNSHC
jgi:hypothetical protein